MMGGYTGESNMQRRETITEIDLQDAFTRLADSLVQMGVDEAVCEQHGQPFDVHYWKHRIGKDFEACLTAGIDEHVEEAIREALAGALVRASSQEHA